MTELTSKLSGFSGAREFTKPLRSKKNPPRRAVSKICGYSVRIHWFRVDGRPIKFVQKKGAVSKKSGFEWTGPELFKEKNYIEI